MIKLLPPPTKNHKITCQKKNVFLIISADFIPKLRDCLYTYVASIYDTRCFEKLFDHHLFILQLWQRHLTLKYKINQIHYTLYLVLSEYHI